MNEEPKEHQATPPEANWQFNATESSQPQAPAQASRPAEAVHWTASEFIQHDKSAAWYLGLVAGTAILAAVVYILTKDKVSTGVVVVVAAVFGVFASRRPRELEYQVDSSGITIGPKSYTYANFKSFSIVDEGGLESIWLMPLKRFMPMITIYFAPGDGQKIVDTLSNYLPVEARKMDVVDRLMHRLRF